MSCPDELKHWWCLIRKKNSAATADAVTMGDAWLGPAIARGLLQPIPEADVARWWVSSHAFTIHTQPASGLHLVELQEKASDLSFNLNTRYHLAGSKRHQSIFSEASRAIALQQHLSSDLPVEIGFTVEPCIWASCSTNGPVSPCLCRQLLQGDARDGCQA